MMHTALNLLMPLMLASALGALVGMERQWRQRMAGLRTNALVSLGAASFTLMSMMVEGDASPTRVAAQVVSGIGFLGAGVIMKEGANIKGLNTAATLWCSAAIGVMAGAGYFMAAVVVASVILATNMLLRPLVRLINRQPIDEAQQGEIWWQYLLEITCREQQEAHNRALLLEGLADSGLQLQKLESENLHDQDASRVCVRARLMATERNDPVVEKVIGRLSLEASVTSAGWDVKEL
ncbi:MAG: MgtC/SapB family protein [Nitrincola lacisaponensis]|uniref:MgtC/SapB family protein n=1 Tax=Nitrincola lacisaponensis TaxID=267850 RepID=UPI00391CD055